MRDLLYSVEFWIAMLVIGIVKLRASGRLTIIGSITSVLSAVGSALIFTDPLLAYLALDPEAYKIAVASLIALTGEHVARQILGITLEDIFRAFGGKK